MKGVTDSLTYLAPVDARVTEGRARTLPNGGGRAAQCSHIRNGSLLVAHLYVGVAGCEEGALRGVGPFVVAHLRACHGYVRRQLYRGVRGVRGVRGLREGMQGGARGLRGVQRGFGGVCG